MSREAKSMVIERPKVEEPGPQSAAPPAGLCINCDHEAMCTFRRRMDQPIAFCDEWTCEDSAPDPIEIAGIDREGIEGETVRTTGTEGRPRGLCMTCEVYPTCLFPKPPDGVWHCEEYR